MAAFDERMGIFLDGDGLITLYGRSNVTQRNAILTGMDGWRGGDVEVETSPKLFGDGAYIKRVHIPPRFVTIGGFLRFNPLDAGYANVNPGPDIVNWLSDAMKNESVVRLDYLYSYDGTQYYRERLSGGRITNVQPPRISAGWQTQIEFTTLFVNPVIDVTQL